MVPTNFCGGITLYYTWRDLSWAAFTAHKTMREEENHLKGCYWHREIGSYKTMRQRVKWGLWWLTCSTKMTEERGKNTAWDLDMDILSKCIHQSGNIRFSTKQFLIWFNFPKLGVDTDSGCSSPSLMFICLSPSRAPRALIAPLSWMLLSCGITSGQATAKIRPTFPPPPPHEWSLAPKLITPCVTPMLSWYPPSFPISGLQTVNAACDGQP